MLSNQICILLARSGSKGLKRKNLCKFNGKPLVTNALSNAKKTKLFEKIILSSDSPEILEEGKKLDVHIHMRSEKNSNDQATSECALLEALGSFNILKGRLYFIQCTTPFLSVKDIYRVFELSQLYPNDTVISGYEQSIHHWLLENNSIDAKPILSSRELRQPRQKKTKKIFVENGGIYSFPIEHFLTTQNRFVNRVIPYKMAKNVSFDIDNEEDLKVAEAVRKVLNN